MDQPPTPFGFDFFPVYAEPARAAPTKRTVRRNPEAPKRPMSPYVTFVKETWSKMNVEMGPKAAAKEVMRSLGERWNGMSVDAKEVWRVKSDEDKARYAAEMRSFSGPITVPVEPRRSKAAKKKAAKDPNAPKRGPSAFLLFANEKRQPLRDRHPEKHNVEISKMLGALWKSSDDTVKGPYLRREAEARDRYEREMTLYRRHQQQQQQQRPLLLHAADQGCGQAVGPFHHLHPGTTNANAAVPGVVAGPAPALLALGHLGELPAIGHAPGGLAVVVGQQRQQQQQQLPDHQLGGGQLGLVHHVRQHGVVVQQQQQQQQQQRRHHQPPPRGHVPSASLQNHHHQLPHLDQQQQPQGQQPLLMSFQRDIPVAAPHAAPFERRSPETVDHYYNEPFAFPTQPHQAVSFPPLPSPSLPPQQLQHPSSFVGPPLPLN